LVEERCLFMTVNYYLSDGYFNIGKLEEYIKYAQDAIMVNEWCLSRIGSALMKLEDFPNAYKYHADVFKITKSHPDPIYRQKYLHWSYGYVDSCQMNMKYYSLAIKNYTKAINLFDSNMSVKLFLRRYLIESSHCYAMLGQLKEAIDVINKTVYTFDIVCKFK
jgi:tetratricopeptide (TPR) repeat protein